MNYETVESNASQLEHLKTVQLAAFRNKEDQLVLLLLMDLLLNKESSYTLVHERSAHLLLRTHPNSSCEPHI